MDMQPGPATKILILAGRRPARMDATPDPLAVSRGISHKCLVPVCGEAMIARVLKIVEEAFPEAPIFVSIESFDVISDEPTVSRLKEAGQLTVMPAAHHIVDSIVEASATTGFPLIVTTADNVLMTADSLRRLAQEGQRSGADAIAVMARAEDIIAVHPEGQKRFYEFRNGGYSNCNMFWLASPTALRATETFRYGGQFAKRPARIVKAFGILNLIRFRLGRHSLEEMFRFASKRFKVDIRPLVLDDGRLAIDVDNERTHRIAEEVLARG